MLKISANEAIIVNAAIGRRGGAPDGRIVPLISEVLRDELVSRGDACGVRCHMNSSSFKWPFLGNEHVSFPIFGHRNNETVAKILALGGKSFLATGQSKYYDFQEKMILNFVENVHEAHVPHKKLRFLG